MKHLRDEMRLRLPILTEKATWSRRAAMQLFCIECMGGSSHDAAGCQERGCWLHPHSFKAQRGYLGGNDNPHNL